MRILIVAGTNLELYYLSSVVCLLKAKDNLLEFSLFLPRTLENNITPEVITLYSKMDLFDMPALTPKISKNPVKMLYNFFDNLRQYWIFKKDVKKNLSGIDMVLICGIKEFFANVLCKLSPKNVRLVALRTANERIEKTADYQRRPILSFFLNIKNFLFGYSIMEYKWRAGLKFSFKRILSNVDNDLIAKKFVKYPYRRTISIADYDIGKNGSNFRLPPPFIALKKIYKIEDEAPSILVAGDQTPLYSNWDGEDQKKYEEFFDYLRSNFKNYKLLFKPKKGKTDPSQYNLEGFQVLRPEISLEEICLRKNIKKVVSIRSSSSKVAAYLEISGYLLYPLFKLPKELKEVVENENYDMQSVVRVNKLEDLKKDTVFPAENYDFETLASLYRKAVID